MSVNIIVFVCLMTVLCHIIDDFVLQNVLAKMKCKDWWLNHPDYKPLYESDYICALFTHALEWSIMVHLPFTIAMLYYGVLEDGEIYKIVTLVIVQTLVHMLIDHLKCNAKLISLCTDQMLHYIQIYLSCVVLIGIIRF